MLTQVGELAPGQQFILVIPERAAEARGSYGSSAVMAILNAETEHTPSTAEPLMPQDLLLDVHEAVPAQGKRWGSLIKLSFDMAALDLETEVKACGEMVYAIYGRAAFDAIHDAIVSASVWPVKEFDLRGEPPTTLHPGSARRKLFDLWYPNRIESIKRIENIQTTMATDIALFARFRLVRSANDTLREASLLFKLDNDTNPGKQEAALLDLPNLTDPYPLNSDQIEPLYRTLIDIADKKERLGTIAQDADRKSMAVLLTSTTSYHSPGAHNAAKAAAIVARQGRNEQAAVYAMELAQIALEMPIMFRLHATDLPAMAASFQRENPRLSAAKNAANFFHLLYPRREIWLQLKKVIDSSRQVGAELQENPDRVWAYPSLVHEYLDAVAIAPGTLAYAAAEESLAKEGEPSILQKASMAAGGGELMAMALGSAEVPPVAATIAIVATLLGTASTAEEEYKKWSERAASWTHIDPGKSLAAEPGYAWSVFNIATTAIDLAGFKRNVKLIGGVRNP